MALGYLAVCVAVDIGTYLFRHFPTRLGAGSAGGRARRCPLGAFLANVGVAAVAALLAAALEVAWRSGDQRSTGAALVCLAVVFGVFRWRKGVALATFLKALAWDRLVTRSSLSLRPSAALETHWPRTGHADTNGAYTRRP